MLLDAVGRVRTYAAIDSRVCPQLSSLSGSVFHNRLFYLEFLFCLGTGFHALFCRKRRVF